MNKNNIENYIKTLIDENQKFQSSIDANFFDKIKNIQTPKITILTCCDSRVQLSAFSQQPINEFFVVRNIGNQISNSEGSLDYGINILKTPILLIIGHTGCGAVDAYVSKADTGFESIQKELSSMNIDDYEVDKIKANVEYQYKLARKKYKQHIDSGDLLIAGAIYDVQDTYGQGAGKLHFIVNSLD